MNVTCTHTHTRTGILVSYKKEGNSSIICDNMDEPLRHYAKSNKLDRER